jgi:5-methylcytosine-specific restriction endonuclease McrA
MNTDPWEGSAGAALLGEVYDFLGRFVAYPSPEAHVAHTLWIGHTHMMDAWESTPRIAFLSPEPGSGKTRALEITELLVPRPVEAVNVTPAYLFRKVAAEEGRPTILFDEIDTVFGPKAKDNEEIRGLLNAGHRKSAVAGRCVVRGKIVETEEIPAYCALALAGLGNLPDTILTRSVVIRMRRRAPNETVEPYRRRVHGPDGERLRDALAGWASGQEAAATIAWPAMPEGIHDRDADVWEPLLAVADLAGTDWSERARVAAVALVALAKESTPSLGVKLLKDIRAVFGDQDQLPTRDILHGLHAIDDSPWGDLKGKPLDDRGLANRLRPYDIKPTTIRDGASTPKGYRRTDFVDAWSRYLQSTEPTVSLCPTKEAQHPQQTKHGRQHDAPTKVAVTVSARGQPRSGHAPVQTLVAPTQDRRLPKFRASTIHRTRESMTRRSWDHGGKSAAQRGYGRRHRELRDKLLKQEPTCRYCRQKNPPRITLATIADHVVPIAKGGAVHDINNLAPACPDCHDAKTRRDNGWKAKPRIGLDGWPCDD